MKMKAYEKIVSKALSKAKYRHVNKCKSEVLNVMKIYRGLSPKFEKFIFDNGEEKDLLNLVGTIPVDYKGHTYNIPIQLWFLYDFPVGSCPMGFVVPTKDMQLKVSNYVDHTGKIVLSYLNTWQYPSSNLIGMIQACREGFGCLPPVFAKTSNVNHTNSNTSSHNTALLNGAAVEDLEGQQDLDEDHERISLLNQVENVMKERFLEEFHKTKAELQTLHSTNKDLLDGQEDIGAIEADFTAKLSQVDACLADLNLEKDHLVQGIEAIDKMNPAALDSDQGMIETTQPIHEQILMCFAQDAALSDAIITLGEGFHHGLFPEGLESYLKKVRALSRQQFYLRATMIKARQVSGLQSESS